MKYKGISLYLGQHLELVTILSQYDNRLTKAGELELSQRVEDLLRLVKRQSLCYESIREKTEERYGVLPPRKAP